MSNYRWQDAVLSYLLPLVGDMRKAGDRIEIGRRLLSAEFAEKKPRPAVAALDLAEWLLGREQTPSFVVAWSGVTAPTPQTARSRPGGHERATFDRPQHGGHRTQAEIAFPGAETGEGWRAVVPHPFSGFILWTQYAPGKKFLRIAFTNGGVREYAGVDTLMAMNFEPGSTGVGKVFNDHFKGGQIHGKPIRQPLHHQRAPDA